MSDRAIEALKAHAEAVKRGEIEVVQLNPIQKLEKNPKSLRLAINAMCYQCMGGYRQEIKNCTAQSCALYNVRPYQTKVVSEEYGDDNEQASDSD